MSETARRRMTSEEFLAWAMEQPEGTHYELEDGEIVAMAPERLAHVRAKQRIYRRLADAIERAGLPCEAFIDGPSVRVDETTIFEPDGLVRCGPKLPDDLITIDDPLVVIEVRSPSTGARDAGEKLEAYFRIPSVRHYLIVKTSNRTVIHHARAEDGGIATRIIRDGVVRLDPPGIGIADIFA